MSFVSDDSFVMGKDVDLRGRIRQKIATRKRQQDVTGSVRGKQTALDRRNNRGLRIIVD